VIATGFGNETGTFSNGQIVWSTGEVWTPNVVLSAIKNGAGPATLAEGSAVVVNDYTINGLTAHVVQTGTSVLVFINEVGNVVLGHWTSATQAVVPAWNNDVATFSAGRINWSDGSLWTSTTTAAPQVTVASYTNAGNGGLTHVIANGTQALAFINEHGNVVLGNWIDPAQALVPAWNNDVATFGFGKINWSDGSVWNQNGPVALPVTVVDDINAGNGLTAHVVQNGTNSVAFVNEHGSVVLGVMLNSTQALVASWNNDVATFSNGQINWSDHSIWNVTTKPAARLTVASYTDVANSLTAFLVRNGGPTGVFVNEQGALVLGSFSSGTQATVAAWNNDVATLSGGNINWSDGSFWGSQATGAPILVTATDTNGAVSHIRLLNAASLIVVDGPLQQVAGTRVNNGLELSNGDLWANFDFNALNALFETATGYP